MISKRTLERWRRDALPKAVSPVSTTLDLDVLGHAKEIMELSQRILKLTRDLLDIELMKGRKS